MSQPQADSEEDREVFKHVPQYILPPDTPEAVMLLLVIAFALTAILHNALATTHIIGTLILILVAKVYSIAFHPQAVTFLAKAYCTRDSSDICQHFTQAQLTGAGKQTLAWTLGVAAEEEVLDMQSGILIKAGQKFQHRAGNIGALMTFVIIYEVANAVYTRAYSIAEASASIAKIGLTSESSTLKPHEKSFELNVKKDSEPSASRSNPLISREDEDISREDEDITKHNDEAAVNENPLKLSETAQPRSESSENACCTACQTVDDVQADWMEVVRHHRDVNINLVEENGELQERIAALQIMNRGLEEQVKMREDRIQYLDVLLEMAGIQLEHETDVKDMLWEAYRDQQKRTEMNSNLEDAGISVSPPRAEDEVEA